MPLITSEQATEAALKQEGIIPDVLDSFHPKTILMVSYGSNNEVALGNTLSVEGPHRYIFLLYKQTPSTNISALTTPLGSHRQGFKAKHFSSQAHLELVGANYFFAENP
ncbi:hypothetical protein BGZ89_005414, partial [Linnemannia elongata]